MVWIKCSGVFIPRFHEDSLNWAVSALGEAQPWASEGWQQRYLIFPGCPQNEYTVFFEERTWVVAHGPHVRRINTINHYQEMNWPWKPKGQKLLLTHRPRMYTTQTEMTFSKTDLDKENFAKGKNEGKLCIAFPRVTGNSSEAVTWDSVSLLLSVQIWVQCQGKEFLGFVPIVMFMMLLCFVLFCLVLWSLFVKGDHLDACQMIEVVFTWNISILIILSDF